MMQITKSFINILNVKTYPVITVANYSDVNNYMDQAELLVVVTAGNIIVERITIWNKLHTIPKDVGLIGHILKYTEDETPYLHEQFFIIRTAAFSKLVFSNGTDSGNELLRSDEDMHVTADASRP
jgi:hypothetical protein